MRQANGRFRNQRAHPGVGVVHPHAVAATNQAGLIDHKRVKADLGVAPKAKRAFTTAPEIPSGMMGKARSDGTHFAGVSGQDLSRYDADGPDPLSGAPRGKTLGTVRPVPGQRSRTNEGVESHADKCQHGADMLAGAVYSGSTRLPATVKED